MGKVAAWLSKYASTRINGSYLSLFGRIIKRSSDEPDMGWEVSYSLSGMKMSDSMKKVMESERNRRLIGACIFTKDAEPSRRVDPSEMEDVGNGDGGNKVRDEVKNFISLVHERMWAQPGTVGKMGRREVQAVIRTDLITVLKELIDIHDREARGIRTDAVSTRYPKPSPAFVGREIDILRLSLTAEINDAVFVCGPAGIGKTEMCRKFAEGWADTDDAGGTGKRKAVWLCYDGDLRSTVAWHLKVNGIRENEIIDEEKLFHQKLSALAEDPRTLLVIDDFNVPEDAHLGALLGYGGKKIFISRDDGHLRSHNGIGLGPLPEEVSLEMFSRSVSSEKKASLEGKEDDVLALLRSVGHHPLTVALIADHINTHATGLKELLNVVSSPAEGDAAVRISGLMGISSLNGRETETLKILSMLPVAGMPLGKFIELSGLDSNRDGDILRSLERKGWIRLTHIECSDDDIVSTDPMVMDTMRGMFRPVGDGCFFFFGSLERFFDSARPLTNIKEKMDLLPVLISAADASVGGPYAPLLHTLAGKYLRNSGNHDASLKYYSKALQMKEKMFGADHPSNAPTYTGIGNVYSDKGDYDKAVEYYIKALSFSGRMSGINDLSIAVTYNNVGHAYSEKGDRRKATEYYKKALLIRERILGANHEDTAATENDLGNTYSDEGKYDEALRCYAKALRVREKIFGSGYYTAVTYGNIGMAHLRRGDYAEALENTVKAMRMLKESLPADNPDILDIYEMIAHIHELLGDDGEMYEEYQSPRPKEDWDFMYR